MGNGNDSETGETAIETDQDTGHANSTDIGALGLCRGVDTGGKNPTSPMGELRQL